MDHVSAHIVVANRLMPAASPAKTPKAILAAAALQVHPCNVPRLPRQSAGAHMQLATPEPAAPATASPLNRKLHRLHIAAVTPPSSDLPTEAADRALHPYSGHDTSPRRTATAPLS